MEGALGTLLHLFVLARETSLSRARDVLGSPEVEALTACGLADAEGDALRPLVELWAGRDLVIAADLRARHQDRDPDFVLPPSGVMLRLAQFMMAKPGGSVLDLGCGSGGLGALAANGAERVVATDVNPRAVEFARFNAELNGLDRMEVREGSLFEPVEGESFHRIFCNPPYVISPKPTYVYRDGGPEISRRIVAEGPGHLTDDGYLQMMAEWPERGSGEWRQEVREWLDGVACDAWVLRFYSREVPDHARLWLRQEYPEGPPGGAVKEWIDHLEGRGITSVGSGLLVLRRARGDAPIRTIRDAPPTSPGTLGDSLASWVSAQTLLASLSDHAQLMDTPLRPAPGLRSTERRAPTGDGWTTERRELRPDAGLRFGADVDPVAREIVGLLDGERTPRQALEKFAEDRGIGPEPFLDGLPGALAGLLELGLLVPAE